MGRDFETWGEEEEGTIRGSRQVVRGGREGLVYSKFNDDKGIDCGGKIDTGVGSKRSNVELFPVSPRNLIDFNVTGRSRYARFVEL